MTWIEHLTGIKPGTRVPNISITRIRTWKSFTQNTGLHFNIIFESACNLRMSLSSSLLDKLILLLHISILLYSCPLQHMNKFNKTFKMRLFARSAHIISVKLLKDHMHDITKNSSRFLLAKYLWMPISSFKSSSIIYFSRSIIQAYVLQIGNAY